MQNFDEKFEANADEKAQFVATNVANVRQFEVKTPDVVVKVSPDRTDLVSTRIIDGRKCLVIALESGVLVNGIAVHMPVDDEADEE